MPVSPFQSYAVAAAGGYGQLQSGEGPSSQLSYAIVYCPAGFNAQGQPVYLPSYVPMPASLPNQAMPIVPPNQVFNGVQVGEGVSERAVVPAANSTVSGNRSSQQVPQKQESKKLQSQNPQPAPQQQRNLVVRTDVVRSKTQQKAIETVAEYTSKAKNMLGVELKKASKNLQEAQRMASDCIDRLMPILEAREGLLEKAEEKSATVKRSLTPGILPVPTPDMPLRVGRVATSTETERQAKVNRNETLREIGRSYKEILKFAADINDSGRLTSIFFRAYHKKVDKATGRVNLVDLPEAKRVNNEVQLMLKSLKEKYNQIVQIATDLKNNFERTGRKFPE